MLRNTALIAFGFALLVLQSAIGTRLTLHPFTPNLVLPMVIYLGVQQDVQLVRGALLTFLLGYWLDEFCGSPMGLSTFVMVATFMVTRGAGIRLFLRGVPFQIVLVFVAALLAGGTVLALRAIFSPPDAFPLEMPASGATGFFVTLLTGGEPRIGHVASVATMLIGSAVTTALLSPFVFAVVRQLESLRARRREAEGVPAS